MVIVVGNEHGDTSSNPGRDWLHFKPINLCLKIDLVSYWPWVNMYIICVYLSILIQRFNHLRHLTLSISFSLSLSLSSNEPERSNMLSP